MWKKKEEGNETKKNKIKINQRNNNKWINTEIIIAIR